MRSRIARHLISTISRPSQLTTLQVTRQLHASTLTNDILNHTTQSARDKILWNEIQEDMQRWLSTLDSKQLDRIHAVFVENKSPQKLVRTTEAEELATESISALKK
jgi:hypothetical protein